MDCLKNSVLTFLIFIFTQVTPGQFKSFNSSWEEWSSWTDCSVTCGFGTSTRYRVWKKDGIILNFTFRDIRECWIQAHCPVHGSWGRWADWDSCTAMCNGGVHRRVRVCNFPVPQHGGRDCDGAKWEVKECNKEECPKIPFWFKLSRCTKSHYLCESRKHCVSQRERCDGKLDCHDGTDEKNCLFYILSSKGVPLAIWRETASVLFLSCILQLLMYVHR